MSEAAKTKGAARPARHDSKPGAGHTADAVQPAAGNNQNSRSGSETRKRSTPVTTRYDDTELAALDDAASRAGLTRASYQRVQTLGTPPKTRSTRRAPIERELLAKALGQLGRVGNNVNQIARVANENRIQLVQREAVETMIALREMLPLFMEALGRKP